jgi:hypothetical protein
MKTIFNYNMAIPEHHGALALHFDEKAIRAQGRM